MDVAISLFIKRVSAVDESKEVRIIQDFFFCFSLYNRYVEDISSYILVDISEDLMKPTTMHEATIGGPVVPYEAHFCTSYVYTVHYYINFFLPK